MTLIIFTVVITFNVNLMLLNVATFHDIFLKIFDSWGIPYNWNTEKSNVLLKCIMTK